jgi:cellulose synthase/poly-beta-1,6-N-acetylglucosamine synthase-like glycosyltransferase
VKKVAIIIPVKEINDYIRESLPHIEAIDYDKKMLDVIVLPDNAGKIEGKFSFNLRIIPTGRIHPGEKRDIGIKKTDAEIVAFIDDDVFPAEHWLKKTVEIFENDKMIGAVGGPAVTPDNDSFLKKVSGYIYSSFLGGGGYRYRYMPEAPRPVDDYPSCNLIVRKDVLDEIGGFNTEFWPGEDTVICLKIVKELKLRIEYHPDILVYHHRRDFPGGHIKQVKSYAKHRGYFVKRFPETSLRLSYFIPTFFVMYLLSLAPLVMFVKIPQVLWFMPLFLYGFLLIIDAFKTPNPAYGFMTAVGIFTTHIFYGVYFVLGLLSGKLKEENIIQNSKVKSQK